MPDVSVRTAWESLLPPGTVFLGGESGLDRAVSWPVVLRTHPPAFDPLRGGELAIVPLDRLRLLDPQLSLARVVSQLAHTRIGAVLAIGPVGEDAIAAADAAGVPLLRLPDGTHAGDVLQSFTRAVAELRAQLTARVGEIGRELNGLAIEGRGRAEIARRAGQIAESIATLLDDGGGTIYAYLPPGSRLDRSAVGSLMWRLAPGLDGATRGSVVARTRLEPDLVALSAPIGRPRAAGHLVLLVEGREPTAVDAAIVDHAVAACAIDLAREEAVLAARDELLGDFLDELVRGDFTSEDALERRGRSLGYELARPHAAFALAWQRSVATNGRGTQSFDESETALELLSTPLSEVDSVEGPLAVRAYGDVVVLLVPLAGAAEGAAEAAIDDLAGRLLAISGTLPFGNGVGYGGVASGPRALSECVERARQALSIGRRLFGAGRLTRFDDLGLYRLLFGVRSVPDVGRFHRDLLGPLIEHDRRSGGELVRTLDAYLSVGCSPTAAAERLHLHRNGLLYRLQRIREILPVDLDDPEQRLGLHLALRIGEILEPAPASEGANGPISQAV